MYIHIYSFTSIYLCIYVYAVDPPEREVSEAGPGTSDEPDPEPHIPHPESETRKNETHTLGPNSDTRSPRSQTRSPKLRNPNQRLETLNPKPETQTKTPQPCTRNQTLEGGMVRDGVTGEVAPAFQNPQDGNGKWKLKNEKMKNEK